jgi:LAS superfamily LD-carboxypeptidase LdcB
MAKSLVNKPEETPEDKDKSEDDEEVSYVRSATGEYDAEITDDIVTQAAAILRSEESFSAKPGWDVNNWRVGYGSSTITDASGKVIKLSSNKSERPDIKITQQDAERDLQRRLRDEFIPHTKKTIGSAVSKLNNATIAALTSVTYNYGTLPATVVQAAKTGDIDKIADAVRSLSANKKRRNREADWIQNSNKSATAKTSKTIATGKNGKLSASDLVTIGPGQKLEPAAAADYLAMQKAAKEDGVTFNTTDSYRPYEIQNAIFDWDRYNRTGEKKKKGTDVAAAYPGTSNHGWGKAIDIFPAAAQTWIKKNGYKYNWSWYEGKMVGEPWHFTWTTDSSKLKEW